MFRHTRRLTRASLARLGAAGVVAAAALSAAVAVSCGSEPLAHVESSPSLPVDDGAAPTMSDASSPPPATESGAPACIATLPTPGWQLVTHGPRLLDSLGRIVSLRGVNAGGHSKQGPEHLPFDFTAGGFDAALALYLDRAVSWGVDVLRVPFTWAAVEPTKGADDEIYLKRFDALLDAAWARHIWVIVDFHQDVYGEQLCGDGFPSWTLANPGMSSKTNCSLWFSEYVLDADVKSSFDRFWNDSDGIQTAYRSLWDRMIARHKDRPGVIGFEVLNEPGWGNAVQSVFEATTLRDFFGTMAARVNAAAPASLVFFDLPGIDALNGTTSMQKPSGKNLVFAPHYYQ